MNNYAQPYRGLPTEIRLMVWSLLIPPRVTVLGHYSSGIPSRSNDQNRLELSRSPQIQLLQLNREIHGEVLPMLKKVGFHLCRGIIYDALWPNLAVALRSPVLGALHYPWHDSTLGGIHHERFLPKLLNHELFNSLEYLHISIVKAKAKTRIDVFPVLVRSDYSVRRRLPERMVLASFSGALLQGTVRKAIIIKIEEIDQRDLELWSPECLYNHVRAPFEPVQPANLTDQVFHNFIRKYAGPIKGSSIHITTEFCETNKSGKYRGTVKFTKVLK